jgi:hypothetical protein
MIEVAGPGVKSKADTKFIERVTKQPDWVGLSERAKPNSG